MKEFFEDIKKDFNLIYKIRLDRLDENELKNIFENLSSTWYFIENQLAWEINLSNDDKLIYNELKDISEMIYYIDMIIDNKKEFFDYLIQLSSNINEMINELKRYIELLERYL